MRSLWGRSWTWLRKRGGESLYTDVCVLIRHSLQSSQPLLPFLQRW